MFESLAFSYIFGGSILTAFTFMMGIELRDKIREKYFPNWDKSRGQGSDTENALKYFDKFCNTKNRIRSIAVFFINKDHENYNWTNWELEDKDISKIRKAMIDKNWESIFPSWKNCNTDWSKKDYEYRYDKDKKRCHFVLEMNR